MGGITAVRGRRSGAVRTAAAAAVVATAALVSPPAAAGLELEIANESGEPDSQVHVTVSGAPGGFDVPGAENDVPFKLSDLPARKLTVNRLVSGRVYVAYGAGVTSSVSFDSPTRFHWAELTVTPSATDVANLTAVDQWAIAMQLETLAADGKVLEKLSSANADPVFDALAGVPGGTRATVRGKGGEILRVLSPLHADSYPPLGEYVRSMAGERVTLNTAFFGSPFTTTRYSGTFARDGSITLRGTTDPPGQAPAEIAFDGRGLIDDIYTGENTPNTVEGAIRRDLLSGFSAGFWGGRYGNDSIDFCRNPNTTPQGTWCPDGFNRPAFGAARRALTPFAACEQYAAVIDRFADAYGNPYSDASGRVLIGLDQPATGGDVTALRLTILPDSGDSKPVFSGDPNCGAASLEDGLELTRRANARRGRIDVGDVSCPPACGKLRVRAVAVPRRRDRRAERRRRSHGKTIARGRRRLSETGERDVVLRLTRKGRKRLRRRDRQRVVVRAKLRGSGELLGKERQRMVFRW